MVLEWSLGQSFSGTPPCPHLLDPIYMPPTHLKGTGNGSATRFNPHRDLVANPEWHVIINLTFFTLSTVESVDESDEYRTRSASVTSLLKPVANDLKQ